MRSRPGRRGFAAIASVTLALAAAACGSSNGNSSDSASSASGPSGSPSSSSAGLKAAVERFSDFLGNKPGAADSSKSPITIEYVNDEGGVPSFPEGSTAANAAVKLLNEKLGGIDGHPLKLVSCLISTGEEQGQACAQKFLNNSAVQGALEISLPVGAQAFHATMGGKKPVIMATPNTLASASGKNSYGISAGVFGTSPGFVGYATGYLHAKTVSLLFPSDDPTGQLAAKQIQGGLAKAGVKVTQAGYKSSATDLLAPVTASGATRTDATIALLPTESSCIAGAKALQQANVTKPILALGLCLGEPEKKALGDFAKWTYVIATTNPNMPSDPDVAGYIAAMKHYAPGANTGGFAMTAFMGVLATAKIAEQAGANDLTPAKLAAAAKAYRGPTPNLSTKLHRPGYIPELSAMMTLGTRAYTYLGNGRFKDATSGKWIGG